MRKTPPGVRVALAALIGTLTPAALAEGAPNPPVPADSASGLFHNHALPPDIQDNLIRGRRLAWTGQALALGGIGLWAAGGITARPGYFGWGALALYAGIPLVGLGADALGEAARSANSFYRDDPPSWGWYFGGLAAQAAGLVLVELAILDGVFIQEDAGDANGHMRSDQRLADAGVGLFLLGGASVVTGWARYSWHQRAAERALRDPRAWSLGPVLVPVAGGVAPGLALRLGW